MRQELTVSLTQRMFRHRLEKNSGNLVKEFSDVPVSRRPLTRTLTLFIVWLAFGSENGADRPSRVEFNAQRDTHVY